MKNIIEFLLLILLLANFSSEAYADKIVTLESDNGSVQMIPAKISTASIYGDNSVSFRYDSLVRIKDMTITKYGLDGAVERILELAVIYDDESLLNKPSKFYTISAIKSKTTDYYSLDGEIQFGIDSAETRFETTKVSPTEILIAPISNNSVKNYTIDYESGNMLDAKLYDRYGEDNKAFYSTKFSYDAKGKMNSLTNIDPSGNLTLEITDCVYDSRYSIFAYVNMPRWFIYGYLSSMFMFTPTQVNNMISYKMNNQGANCVNVATISYLYNEEGYPIEYAHMSMSIDGNSDCSSNSFRCKIEYIPIDDCGV